MKQQQFDRLFERYLSRSLTEEEASALKEALRQPEWRERWVALSDLEGLLADEFAVEDVGVVSPSASGARGERRASPSSSARLRGGRHRRRRVSPWMRNLGLPLAAAAAAAVIFLMLRGGAPERARPQVATHDQPDTAPAGEEPAPSEQTAREPALAAPESDLETEEPRAAVEARVAAPIEPVVPTEAARTAAPHVEGPRPREEVPAPEEPRLAYLDWAHGDVETDRAGDGRWVKAATGSPFQPGDRFRTKYAQARIAFESGSTASVNRFTTLTFPRADRTGISMIGGEVYAEVADEDTGFFVETPHGRATDLGTRFGVEAERAGTTVVVVEGRVEASTDAGKVALKANQEVLLARRTLPPGKVRRAAQLDRKLAWTKRGARARTTAAFFDDFEGSPLNQWPSGWRRHLRDPESRSGFAVLEEVGAGAARNRFISCRNARRGRTQHALIPFGKIGDRFMLTVRVRATGRRLDRAGVEIWSERDVAVSAEYSASRSSLSFSQYVNQGWRVIEQKPLHIAPGTWMQIRLTYTPEQILVAVDGRPMFAQPQTLSGDPVGIDLISRGNDSAEYDDVRIDAPSAATQR